MPIRRARQRITATRLAALARGLLNASTLCAISTVSAGGRAHINTAYFAWGPTFEIVWWSAPQARHSQNVRRHPSVAIAVYDSRQKWGGSDRGVQLFGTAREVRGRAAREVERIYARRFTAYSNDHSATYRFYRFRPRSLKLLDERELGGATFVTAQVSRDGRLIWRRTESYVSAD